MRELDQAPASRGDSGRAQDVLWTSRTGSTLIVSAIGPGTTFGKDRLVTGILRGSHLTPLPGDWQQVGDVAW